MNEEAQLALSFLEKIHSYYPIGLPHLRDEYKGFQKLLSIQSRKMSEAMEGRPESWNLVVGESKKLFGEEASFDMIANPFPSYQLLIHAGDEERPGVRKRTSVTLTISLLVDFYALFVVDDYEFIDYESGKTIGTQKVISSGVGHPALKEGFIEHIKTVTQAHFPSHQFAPHPVLFKYRIFGAFGLGGWFENLDKSVIYDYLFGSELVEAKYSVAT